MEEEERRYETKIDIKTYGYLIGPDKNGDMPKLVVKESAAEIKFARERTIFGDVPQHGGDGVRRGEPFNRNVPGEGIYRE